MKAPGRFPLAAAVLLAIATAAVAGCSRALPEPDSEGARLYAQHCNNCHRVYAPGTLTYEMWKYQVERMQGVIVRQGLKPLTPAERDTVLDYLRRHSG